MNTTGENNYSIASVEKAFTVLEYIVRHTSNVSAIEIHSQTGIAKPTLHKILQTLKELGYIDQNPDTSHYFSTMKLLQTAYYSINRHDFFKTYYPYILMYMRRFHCPCSLVIYSGTDSVIVYSSVGTSNVIVDNTRIIGCTLPLYASSSGRLLLSSLDENLAKELLVKVPLTPLTGCTLCTVDEIIDFVRDIKKKGYCRIDGEIYYGFSNIAFPLRDTTGRMIGSMNFVIPKDQVDTIMSEETVSEILTTMDKVRLKIV